MLQKVNEVKLNLKGLTENVGGDRRRGNAAAQQQRRPHQRRVLHLSSQSTFFPSLERREILIHLIH